MFSGSANWNFGVDLNPKNLCPIEMSFEMHPQLAFGEILFDAGANKNQLHVVFIVVLNVVCLYNSI